MALQRNEGQSNIDLGKSRRTASLCAMIDVLLGPTANPANTTENTIFSVTVPPGTLNLNNQGLRIRFAWSTGATGNNKRVRIYYGATVIFDTGTRADNNLTGYGVVELYRQATNVEASLSTGVVGTNIIAPAFSVAAESTGGYASGTGVIVKMTGQNGTAAVNEIVGLSMSVEWVSNGGVSTAGGILV